MIALSLLAVMAVSACGSHSGTWTPMSAGRTAGEGTLVEKKMPKKAERVFSESLRK
jgi:hypothetical protein